jgi:hypothetical protein
VPTFSTAYAHSSCKEPNLGVTLLDLPGKDAVPGQQRAVSRTREAGEECEGRLIDLERRTL